MCIFSGHVEHVGATQIFARRVSGQRQALIYSMEFAAANELAMVLPLPVPPGSAEHAVEFVDLSDYSELFVDLKRAFPEPVSRGTAVLGWASGAAPQAPLPVVAVGEFEASFVPRIADFQRLDPRFQLDPRVWHALPQYADFGFAVFKLRPSTHGNTAQRVHPMALIFPHRHPYSVFMPTLHVHQGAVHSEAAFDHMLYVQPPDRLMPVVDWRRSEVPLGSVLDASRLAGLIDVERPAQLLSLVGLRRNQDVVL